MTDDTVERVAAAMWKAEAVDSGSPESVAMRRTPEEFAVQADETRAKWHKFARAAIAAMTPQEAAKVPRLTDAEVADLRLAFVDHDDERDEPLAAVIEWYIAARAISEDSHE